MGLTNKMKQKLLKNDDSSVNSNNDSYDDLIREIKSLKLKVKSQEKELKSYKEFNNRVLDSHQFLLNTLLIEYELVPKGIMKYNFELFTELIKFTCNVCQKYNLAIWLDWGTALGAYRHGGFIPFDDDADMGMMRQDYFKFNEIIEDEISSYGLDDLVSLSPYRYSDEKKIMNCFTKVEVNIDDVIYSSLDIFPYDYVKNDFEDVEKVFKEIESSFHINVIDGMSQKQAVDEFYQKYGFSYDAQDFIFPCIHTGWLYSKFDLVESSKIFPLRNMEFNGVEFPVPNDMHFYLVHKYGENYNEIPKIIYSHDRIKELKKEENCEEKFIEYINRIKKVNDNF